MKALSPRGRNIRVRLVSACILVAVLLPVWASAFIGIKEGDVPKGFALADINGERVETASVFGRRPAIILFWKLAESRAFLDYSLDELLFLREVYETYHTMHGLEIFGIYIPKQDGEIPDGEKKAVQDLVKRNNIPFPVLLDEEFRVFKNYGVIAIPSTVMIDTTGKTGFIYPSFPLSARPLFSEKITELLGLEKGGKRKEAKKELPPSGRLYHYALQMYRKGLLEQAVSPLKKSLETDPDLPRAHNLMGIILWEKGDVRSAADEFLSALHKDKRNGAAHFNYGFLLYENREFEKAEAHLREAIDINSENAAAHYILGLLYDEIKRPEEAEGQLKKALELFEGDKVKVPGYSPESLKISALYALSEVNRRAGREKEATDLLRRAVRIVLGFEGDSGAWKHYRGRKLMLHE